MIPAKRRLEQLSDVDATDEHQPEDHALLIRQVYRTVWKEFDGWSNQDFNHSIKALVTISAREIDEDDIIVGGFGQLELQDSKSELTTSYALADPHIVKLKAPFKPTPSYDSCTPVSDNHFTGDDSSDMPFIPLADDPSFDWKEYCEQYKSFAWQNELFDCDLHAMVAETAHRLHQQYGLSYTQIDDTAELPLSLTSSQDGILRTVRYQGFFDWTDAKHGQSKLLPPVLTVPVQVEFKQLVSQFCNSANCMTGFCDQHINWYPIPSPLSVSPHLDSSDLFSDTISPCGDDCFILRVPGNVPAIETEWTQNDLNTFQIFLDHSPDSSPCDLAIICKKPCFEIFKRRKNMLPDSDIKRRSPQSKAKRPPRSRHAVLKDLGFHHSEPYQPCHHQGLCNAMTNCACFKNKAHCERSCRCDPRLCRRQWAGCNCARTKAGRPCRTERCACVRAHRECDPELCGKCDARDQFRHDGCSNVSIQRRHWKYTEVKPGTWGVGLFLLEPVDTGELIIEYVGELVYETTSDSRDDVSQHRQRNYVFRINGSFDLDSEFIGNESRYINHSRESPNCVAQIMLVTGSHRIGIYALTRLETGTELFLDYGPEFFKTT
ncbi:SET domain-containing protein [Lentinula aff. detonsa]|uniref:SET domain-containing protein n=1 Tax=Lentinula aff. detonsa TaxID=2804958 RepID=A0AA38KCK4_9AGAR|nr:SET domain-containing protein [Lentinula aff. detonsa]